MTERERWAKLTELAEQDDIGGYYALYAEYLEDRGIHSFHRRTIHKMALAVVQRGPH